MATTNIKKSISVSVSGIKEFVSGSKESAKNLELAKQKAQQLTEALQAAAKDASKSSAEVAKLEKALARANDRVQQLEKAGSGMSDAFSKFGGAATALAGGISAAKEAWGTFNDETKTAGEKVTELADQASSVLMGLGPYGAAAALAIQGLSYAWSYFNQEAEEAAQIQREVDEVTDNLTKSIVEEVVALDSLQVQLTDTNLSYTERKDLLDEIQSKYGKYIENLKLENMSLDDQVRALDRIREKMIENMIQKGIQQAQAEQMTRMLNAQINMELALEEGRKKSSSANTARYNKAAEELEDARKKYDMITNSASKLEDQIKKTVGAQRGIGGIFFDLRIGVQAAKEQAAAKAAEEAAKAAQAQAAASQNMAASQKTAVELLREQLDILKAMAKISAQRQADITSALEMGNFDEAQKLLDMDMKAWELEKERLRTTMLNGEVTLEQIKNKQEELIVTKQLAEAQEVNLKAQRNMAAEAVKQRVITDMQAGDIKTILGAQLFQGIEIPEEFKSSLGPNLVTVFKDATGKRTQQQLDQVLAEAFKTADPLKYLRERGVSSVFDAIDKRNNETFKRNADNIKKQEAELKILEEKYQKQESEGKRDIDAEDRERQKEFAKRQKEIDKARKDFNERVQKAEEEAAKRLSELSKALNDPQYLEQLQVLQTALNNEQLKTFDDNLNTILPLINKVNMLREGAVKTDRDTRTIEVTSALNDLLNLGQITQEEYNQILSISQLQNELIDRQKREAEKRLADLKKDFIGQVLDALRKENMESIKDYEQQLERLQQLRDQADSVLLPEIDTKRQEGKYMEALELRKTYMDGQMKLIAEQERIEKELAGKMFESQLLNLQQQGFDTQQLREDFFLKEQAISMKYNSQRLRLRKDFTDAEKALTEENIKEVSGDVQKWLGIVDQTFMAGYRAVMDYINTVSQATIDQFNTDLDQVETQLSDAQNQINSLEDDLEGKRSGRRQAVLAAIELEQQREQELAKEKIRLMKEIEAEERAMARRRKQLAITEAVINGAQSIASIWSVHAANPILAGILTAVAAGVTAAQIGTISAQEFADGGYTGEGTVRDHTGHRVAGVVHDGEWVAPKWMVNSPSFAPVIGNLERSRQGLTPNFSGMSSALSGNNTMEKTLMTYTEAMMRMADRPVVANPVEFNVTASNMKQRQMRNSLGG